MGHISACRWNLNDSVDARRAGDSKAGVDGARHEGGRGNRATRGAAAAARELPGPRGEAAVFDAIALLRHCSRGEWRIAMRFRDANTCAIPHTPACAPPQ